MNGRQRGMSLVAAIFLIVIIAALASFAVTAGTSKLSATNQAVLADRAAAAAHAGAEWGAYRARALSVCPGSASPTTFNINQGGLRGFRVTVTCTSSPAYSDPPPAVGTYWVRDIDSFAQYGNFGAADYASARATTRVWTNPSN